MRTDPYSGLFDLILFLFASLPFVVLVIWMFFRVSRKSGRSGWWSLLLLVPWANIVAVWVFAFVRWPALDAPKADEPPGAA